MTMLEEIRQVTMPSLTTLRLHTELLAAQVATSGPVGSMC